MLILGPVSSLYDFITFGILLLAFHAGERLFHTGWFVESLLTQALVILVIRTRGNPLESKPSKPLFITVTSVAILALLLPYTPVSHWFGFTPLSLPLVLVMVILTITYLVLVQIIKVWFYKRYSPM